ncbi:MAG: hypothetical protein ACRD21_16950 [Vicinamibacteria bacterium]
MEKEAISDIAAVRDNHFSVTPLQFDFTAYTFLEDLESRVCASTEADDGVKGSPRLVVPV